MELRVATKDHQQVIDITDEIQEQLDSLEAYSGLVTITALHTTCAVTVADLDPGTDQDFLDFLDTLIPALEWRHPHDPSHAPAHLLSALIGPSIGLPIQKGQLLLGTWQRIVLVEFEGPRERHLSVVFVS